MPTGTDRSFLRPLKEFVSTLKSPYLVMLAAAVFLLDLAIPDPLPFVDELVLLVVTILLARRKRRKPEPETPALRGGSGEAPALRGGSGETPALRGGSGEAPDEPPAKDVTDLATRR